MASKEEKVNALKYLGLNEQKIEETLKNEALSNFLIEISNHVIDLLPCNLVHDSCVRFFFNTKIIALFLYFEGQKGEQECRIGQSGN